ncbi:MULTISPECIES: ATP synthase F1 subunit epsilon [unclassified Helicobacter]|uniref:ATP synthase F1 subunit epsilon n=1 Tax=unclassified Helicobacter TaxID=2593540 RepID=UPI000CF03791|nr:MULTISPECIES: ATP synthase F1 subunit epsilon [unclassified Helicobacter]
MDTLMVSIITPYGKIFDGMVTSMTLPGFDGEFGVVEGHSDLLSLLKTGTIEIVRGDQRDLVAINWGYAKIQSNQVDVLVDNAVLISENKGDINLAIQNAKKLLEESSNDKIAISSVVSRIDKYSSVKGM